MLVTMIFLNVFIKVSGGGWPFIVYEKEDDQIEIRRIQIMMKKVNEVKKSIINIIVDQSISG